jgi:cyclomaltodextrinase / maltogenic alpha-amylase / neopullulanase
MSEPLLAGVYEHWKGGHYLVLGIGRYDSTNEEVVVYVRLYGRQGVPLSVRPKPEFFADVEVEGKLVPRFRHLGIAE